jgi:hypothetical protein
MWKLALGFVAFAALSLFVIFKAGGNIDMFLIGNQGCECVGHGAGFGER